MLARGRLLAVQFQAVIMTTRGKGGGGELKKKKSDGKKRTTSNCQILNHSDGFQKMVFSSHLFLDYFVGFVTLF